MEFLLLVVGFIIVGGILLSLYGPAPVKVWQADTPGSDQLEITRLQSQLATMTSAYAKASARLFAANQVKRVGLKSFYRDERQKEWVVEWSLRDCDMAAARVTPAMIETFFGV